jgi:hypothetical protein
LAIANATRLVSIAYSLIFVLGGVLIIGGLLAQGMTPFVIAAAGGVHAGWAGDSGRIFRHCPGF